MKKCLFVALSFLCYSSGLYAVPYASYLKIGTNDVNPASGTLISYILNEDADSVIIEILNESSINVASFAGGTSRGENTVNWNGTIDNASGAAIPVGTYTFRVKVDKNVVSESWREIGAVRSAAPDLTSPPPPAGGITGDTMAHGFGIKDLLFVNDQNSDNYGLTIAYCSYNVSSSLRNFSGAAKLRSDLKLVDQTDRLPVDQPVPPPFPTGSGGFNSRFLKLPFTSTAQSDIWHGTFDPVNSNKVVYFGQHATAANQILSGEINSGGNLTPIGISGFASPRDGVLVVEDGSTKYLYTINGTGIIRKTPVNFTTNVPTGNPVQITTTLPSHYMRGIEFDSEGNLYVVTKQTASDFTGGRLFRWNAAKVAGAPAANMISVDNADWIIDVPAGLSLHGPTIDRDGNVYLIAVRGDNRGLYFAGNKESSSLVKTLTVSDRLVDTDAIGTPPAQFYLNGTYAHVASDPVGNIALIDIGNEMVRMYSRPGNSSETTKAPTSQAFTVNLNAKVEDWKVY